MVLNIGIGFAQFVAFVASLGLDTPAAIDANQGKAAMTNAVDKSATNGVNQGLKTAQTVAASATLKASLLQRMETLAAEKLGTYAQTQAINFVCGTVGNSILNNIQGASAIKFNPAALDPTGIASSVQSCGTSLSDQNSRILCAKSIMNVVSNIDPTGIVSIAAALVEPICDV